MPKGPVHPLHRPVLVKKLVEATVWSSDDDSANSDDDSAEAGHNSARAEVLAGLVVDHSLTSSMQHSEVKALKLGITKEEWKDIQNVLVKDIDGLPIPDKSENVTILVYLFENPKISAIVSCSKELSLDAVSTMAISSLTNKFKAADIPDRILPEEPMLMRRPVDEPTLQPAVDCKPFQPLLQLYKYKGYKQLIDQSVAFVYRLRKDEILPKPSKDDTERSQLKKVEPTKKEDLQLITKVSKKKQVAVQEKPEKGSESDDDNEEIVITKSNRALISEEDDEEEEEKSKAVSKREVKSASKNHPEKRPDSKKKVSAGKTASDLEEAQKRARVDRMFNDDLGTTTGKPNGRRPKEKLSDPRSLSDDDDDPDVDKSVKEYR